MVRELVHVGVREFRKDLARYMESAQPVAVTRHGQMVGYYLPTPRKVDEKELEEMEQIGERIDALLGEHGITEEDIDEMVEEFNELRHQS
ncbi:MAG: type II toxin-antitoxin system Phd/YefM family antitoxin [Chloroflexi bacterium]|nr:type II toxin-antitoxin system Phd/YefM family antitoxin [Chloroflexota bacterium]